MRFPTSILEKECIKIGLYGLGISTLGALDYLLSVLKYKEVRITLRSDIESYSGKLPERLRDCEVLSGRDCAKRINEDLLIVSPSVRRDKREFSLAAERGTFITSDAEIFFSEVTKPVFAISGSDGKSTTATLAHLLLGADEGGARLCGNIGVALSPVLKDAKARCYVTELSSFMLNSFAPTSESATLTNVTPNHLNWHRDMEEYIGAKENILKNAKRTVLWHDDPVSRNFIKRYGADTVISTNEDLSSLKREYSARHYITRQADVILLDGEAVCRTETVARYGEHTIKNLMNALALTVGYCNTDNIDETLTKFTPLPHRLQYLGKFRGIEFINSSIDSTPQRTATSLSALGKRVTLILCGAGKGLSLEPLREPILKYAAHVIVGGGIKDEAAEFVRSIGFDKSRLTVCRDLYDCVSAAVSVSSGDTVLLSPSATSFDEFKNYEDRGSAFMRYIKEFTQ